MKNLTGDHLPLLASRAPRGVTGLTGIVSQNGAGEYGGGIYPFQGALVTVVGQSLNYGGAVRYASLTPGPHRFCALGTRLMVLPEKLLLSADGSVESAESVWTGAAQLTGGTIFGETAAANTIKAASALPFRAGDAVTVSGSTGGANDLSAVVREVSADGKELRFYENTFTLPENTESVSETALTISRSMPDLDFLCENENRLWGCKGSTIYASALGDPCNWQRYDGLSTDSWTASVGSDGEFTGCCSYKGFPVFFKREGIYKIYGSQPSKYQIMESCTLGVEPGCAGSLAVAGETLYYLSRAGFCAYAGGEPVLVSEALGDAVTGGRVFRAEAGSDGVKYYVSLRTAAGPALYVLDTRNGGWFREDPGAMGSGADCASAFALCDGSLLMLTSAGDVLRVSGAPWLGETTETGPDWQAEFGEFTLKEADFRRLLSAELRFELDSGASAQVALSCDGGAYTAVCTLPAAGSGQIRSVRVTPRRCDRWSIRISGSGGMKLHTLEFRIRR